MTKLTSAIRFSPLARLSGCLLLFIMLNLATPKSQAQESPASLTSKAQELLKQSQIDQVTSFAAAADDVRKAVEALDLIVSKFPASKAAQEIREEFRFNDLSIQKLRYERLPLLDELAEAEKDPLKAAIVLSSALSPAEKFSATIKAANFRMALGQRETASWLIGRTPDAPAWWISDGYVAAHKLYLRLGMMDEAKKLESVSQAADVSQIIRIRANYLEAGLIGTAAETLQRPCYLKDAQDHLVCWYFGFNELARKINGDATRFLDLVQEIQNPQERWAAEAGLARTIESTGAKREAINLSLQAAKDLANVPPTYSEDFYFPISGLISLAERMKDRTLSCSLAHVAREKANILGSADNMALKRWSFSAGVNQLETDCGNLEAAAKLLELIGATSNDGNSLGHSTATPAIEFGQVQQLSTIVSKLSYLSTDTALAVARWYNSTGKLKDLDSLVDLVIDKLERTQNKLGAIRMLLELGRKEDAFKRVEKLPRTDMSTIFANREDHLEPALIAELIEKLGDRQEIILQLLIDSASWEYRKGDKTAARKNYEAAFKIAREDKTLSFAFFEQISTSIELMAQLMDLRFASEALELVPSGFSVRDQIVDIIVKADPEELPTISEHQLMTLKFKDESTKAEILAAVGYRKLKDKRTLSASETAALHNLLWSSSLADKLKIEESVCGKAVAEVGITETEAESTDWPWEDSSWAWAAPKTLSQAVKTTVKVVASTNAGSGEPPEACLEKCKITLSISKVNDPLASVEGVDNVSFSFVPECNVNYWLYASAAPITNGGNGLFCSGYYQGRGFTVPCTVGHRHIQNIAEGWRGVLLYRRGL